jgi:hypothetical protein
MPRGKFSLCNRDVDDFVRACAVAARVDVRLRGLLPVVDSDPAVVEEIDARGCEVERVCVRYAAECVEQVGGFASDGLSGVLELNYERIISSAVCPAPSGAGYIGS